MKKIIQGKVSNKTIGLLAQGVKSSRRFLAILGVIGMLWSYIPWQNIYAITDEDNQLEEIDGVVVDEDSILPDYPLTTDLEFDSSQVEIDYEVINERTADSKTFRKIDGTYEVALYNEVVHYYEDGEWIQINNSFNDKGDELETKDNKFKLKFPKYLDDNKKIKLVMDDYGIDWSILDINSSAIEYDTEEVKSNNIEDLVNINQSLIYSNVQQGVDIEYIVTGEKIKENIILNQYVSDFSMTFEYKLENLELVEDIDGNILFANENNEVVFVFNDLFMLDNDLNESWDIEYSLVEIRKKTYEITITPSDEWLETAVYPVTVDPSLVINGSDNPGIRDKYAWQTGTSETTNYLKVGKSGTTIYKSYVEVDTISIPDDAIVTYSHMQLRTYYGTDYNKCDFLSCQINVKQVNNDSEWSDITNSTFSNVNNFIEDYEFVYPTDIGIEYYHWDITKLVIDWVSKEGTLGILELSKQTTVTSDMMYFASEEYGTTIGPNITIGYQITTGLYDFWTYHSIPVGDAGTAMISDFTGELSVIRNDYTGTHGGMVIDFGMFYSENLKDTDIGYGNGWRTNFNSFVEENGDEYVVTNPSGSETYFEYVACEQATDESEIRNYASSCYLADDGSRNILIEQPLLDIYDLDGDNYTNDYVDTTSVYSTNRIRQVYHQDKIKVIEDLKTGNFLKIEYSGDFISRITDHYGNYIQLHYDNSQLEYAAVQLCQTWSGDACQSTNLVEVIEYSYTSGNMTDIGYHMDYRGTNTYVDVIDILDPDFQTFISNTDNTEYNISYMYDTSLDDKLTSMKSSEDYQVEFTYDSTTLKVEKYELTNGSLNLGYIEIDYQHNVTVFTDFKSNAVKYSFDSYGHTVNILDNHGNATYYRFLNPWSNTIERPNLFLNHKLVESSSPQKTQINPIGNHSFEFSSLSQDDNWDFIIDSTAGFPKNPMSVYSSLYSLIGDEAARIFVYPNQTAHLEQDIILDNNTTTSQTYTLSGYVFADTSTSAKIAVTIGGTTSYSNVATTAGEWNYVEVDFNISSDNTVVTVKLINSVLGTAYFDNVQISDNYVETRVNLIDNPSFEFNSTGWSVYNATRTYDGSENDDVLFDSILGDYYMKIIGDADTIKSFETTLSSSEFDVGSSFIIAGWAKGDVTPSKYDLEQDDNRQYGIIVELYDGSTTDDYYFPFNSSIEDWQYQANKIYIDDTIVTVKVKVVYCGEGTVYFDGLQLYNESFGTEYYYDDFGNPEFIQTPESSGLFEYNYYSSNRFLLDYTVDQNGKVTNSTYESSGYLSSVSQSNVVSSVSRTDGVITSLKIGEDSNSDGVIDGSYYQNLITYSTNNQYINEIKNEFDDTVNYNFSSLNGLLDLFTIDNVDTSYEYDFKGRIIELEKQNSNITYVYFDDDDIMEIQFNGITYQVEFDSLGRIKTARVGTGSEADSDFSGQSLKTFIYEIDTENGNDYQSNRLSEQQYGNGDKIKFNYDDESRMTGMSFWNGTSYVLRFEYSYNQSGILTLLKDNQSNMEYYYSYDLMGRIQKVTNQTGDTISYDYDNAGNISLYDYDISGYSREVSYNYDLQTGIYLDTKYSIGTEIFLKTYLYETGDIKLLVGEQLTLDNGTPTNEVDDTVLNTIVVSYFEGTEVVNGNISERIKSITQIFSSGYISQTIEYNNQSFITKITNQDSDVIEFYYDDLDQLYRENNESDDYTYIYIYDDYGNLELQYYYAFTLGNGSLGLPTFYEIYTYDTVWKDKIDTVECGIPMDQTSEYTITYNYDDWGNLSSVTDSRTTVSTISFDWEGRNLVEYSQGSNMFSYTYNQNGIRNSKTVNGVTTSYYLDGSLVIYETDGTHEIYYSYDVDGSLISMRYDGDEYFYVFNIFGDITNLLDENGNSVVEYRYDSFGNIIFQTSGTLAEANPYRYRSYRYDQETKYYYLQSRYYNPESGRFINADGMLSASSSVLGTNMFAYTENNPVMSTDPDGYQLCLLSSDQIVNSTGCLGPGGSKSGWSPYADSKIVIAIDLTGSFMIRGGGTYILNFTDGYTEFYPHTGASLGFGYGGSIAIGIVSNYEKRGDYGKDFVYAEASLLVGGGRSWDPTEPKDERVKTTYVMLSFPSPSLDWGYDYYHPPKN